MLASTAALATSAPKPTTLVGVTHSHLAAWLGTALKRGQSLSSVLELAQQEALRRCAFDVDLHPLLLAGPAQRLGPTPELVLWVLFHIVDLSESTCRTWPAPAESTWREQLAQHACRVGSDAHPWVLASEVHRPLPGLLDAMQGPELPVVAEGNRTRPAEDVAQAIRAGEELGYLTGDALWHGLWMAAAQAQAGIGGMLNATHCITLLPALARLATPERRYSIGLAAARRFFEYGPSVVEADLRAPSPMSAAQWTELARHPGADVHDLKFTEAVLNAPAAVEDRVRGLCARSSHATSSAPDPRFTRILEAFQRTRN